MMKRIKTELDKFAKVPEINLPVYKYNKKKQNLDIIDTENTQDTINNNRTLTLQEMIEKKTYIFNEKDPSYADISNMPVGLNAINREAKINNELDNRLQALRAKALKEQKELLEKLKETQKELKEINKQENKQENKS